MEALVRKLNDSGIEFSVTRFPTVPGISTLGSQIFVSQLITIN